MSLYRQHESDEWQTDEHGNRYRMVGKVREYETLISISGTMVPESKLEEFRRKQAEAAAQQLEAERIRTAAAPPQRTCPFSEGFDLACTGEKCALYLEGCTLAQISDQPPIKDTKGLACPLNRYRTKCREACALYENGCKLTAIQNPKKEDK